MTLIISDGELSEEVADIWKDSLEQTLRVCFYFKEEKKWLYLQEQVLQSSHR